MIDFEAGWRAVPGMLNIPDATVIQRSARMCLPGTAAVETGAWCGRSLAALCEVVPRSVKVFSYDNYLDFSQAHDGGNSPITPSVAMNLRKTVESHFEATGVEVKALVKEASEAGKTYDGPPVSLLFIDDHHSEEQIRKNLDAWLPHCSIPCILLFHDYAHPPYRIKETCEEMLPVGPPNRQFKFVGQPLGSGIGIWQRGF